MTPFQHSIKRGLSELSSKGLYRRLAPIKEVHPPYLILSEDGVEKRLIDFSSNDYLGLSAHPALKEAAAAAAMKWGSGSRASRLLSGNHPLHEELEEEAANFKGTEAALLFGSGYLANSGIIPALVGRGDIILADRQVHASIIDAIKISGAQFRRFRHNDLAHLEELLLSIQGQNGRREGLDGDSRRILVVVESLYSMDGDTADISALLELKEKFGFILMVDEAHAVGIAGQGGCGLVPKDLASNVDIMIATCGKALGSYGAFCATSSLIKEYLINRCRTTIFSTALPPPVLAASMEALRLVPGMDKERKRVMAMSKGLWHFIEKDLGRRALGQMQIVSLVLGRADITCKLEEFLKERGIFARAIRPPTVAKGSERIRFSLTSLHGDEELDTLKQALAQFFS